MNSNIFNIENFNIIQDKDNYYFFRALNMADNADIENGVTISSEGEIERIRTDRERYEGATKYSESSRLSLEEIYDHIKIRYRKDTNCISLTSNANVAVTYGRGSYKDKYVMVRIPKNALGNKVVVAGQYMLQQLNSRIEQAINKLPEEEKARILNEFKEIDGAKENKTLENVISKRYTANSSEINVEKAHLREGITYTLAKSRISTSQALNEKQTLEMNKLYAKLGVLENENKLKNIIPHSSNSKLRGTIGNAFSSLEAIHYGEIKKENIIEVSKEVVDIFALIQQISDIKDDPVRKFPLGQQIDNIEGSGIGNSELSQQTFENDINGIEKIGIIQGKFETQRDNVSSAQIDTINKLKEKLLSAIQNNKEISKIPEIDEKVKANISIEEMYNLTEGKIEYGKANSAIKNMFYLSKSRQNAIALSKVLSEALENRSDFNGVIKNIEENGFRVEPEIISRKNGEGIRLSETVNLELENEEQKLIDEIKKYSTEELTKVLENGGLYNANDIITKTYGNIRKNEKIEKQRYYAEAIISKYNWKEIGKEGFNFEEKEEFITKLQSKNCIEIYEKLNELGIEESKIPTMLLNITTRDGIYEQYEKGQLKQLLDTREDTLENNISIETVERFLGYYDVENTGIRLKDYQQRAYNKIGEIFENNRFAQLTLPTGAGKSFVALAQMKKYAEENYNEKILYLAPQDEIINQIKSNIINYVHGKQGTVGKTEDEIISETFKNITFETYPGLLALRGKSVIKEKYGMIVLDELHRAGAEKWEKKVNKLLENQTENVKVLGITATPRRDDNKRENMANKIAKKLGYTDLEIEERRHIAANITLENAIRMGYVVNPKIVYCKYDLISSGKMNELKTKIDGIEDEGKRREELGKYDNLLKTLNSEIDNELGEETRKKLEEEARKNLDNGIGKEKIIRQNVKMGGKYIVFIPDSDQGDIEDEDGNRIGTKNGEDKILAYQDYLSKVFGGTEITPQFHSMLGSYSKARNKEELMMFEKDKTDKTKFMIVMNKANEGLHIDGIDGIIWFRALDKNSKILYLQQLGRAIYPLDEDNPLSDDKRPIIIDLANNTLNVDMEEKFEKTRPIDDLENFKIVIEWINRHNGMLPKGQSSSREEQHYYAILRRIQSKYGKYLGEDLDESFGENLGGDLEERFGENLGEDLGNDLREGLNENSNGDFGKTLGFNLHEGELSKEDVIRIKKIMELASEIDLWDIELPPIPRNKSGKSEFSPFTVEGVLKDFVRLKNEVDTSEEKSVYDQVIEFLETHDGRVMRGILYNNGRYLKKDEMTKEESKEINLYQRWLRSIERNILKQYVGQPIENVPEEYREKIAKLRSFDLEMKRETRSLYEQVIEFLETHDGRLMRSNIYINGIALGKSELTEEERIERNLYQMWTCSIERKLLNQYAGQPIENVPEEYREKIAKLRCFNLEIRRETGSVYENVIKFLKTHDGRLMRGNIYINGKFKKINEMTKEEKKEKNLYHRWFHSTERKILNQYIGQPIENIPEEYREKISKLREFGLGMEKSKLSTAKQKRDDAKQKNEDAKKLEEQVTEQLLKFRKKWGKNRER